jgi:hypothetical protein
MKRNQRSENSLRESSSRSPIFYGKNQKILLFVGLLLLVIYHFGRPTFEKVLGIELPQLIADGTENRNADVDRESNGTKPSTKGEFANPKTTSPAKKKESSSTSSKFNLEKAGGDNLKSPEGLIYGMGPNREHRVDHVLRHAVDDPSRPVHSVFTGDRDEVLALIDEAYRLVKQKSPQARSQKSSEGDNRTENVIDLKRPIGYKGGKNGARDGYPQLFKIKLILEDSNRVVTAFPF